MNMGRGPVFGVLDLIEGQRLFGSWRFGRLGGLGGGIRGQVSQAGNFSFFVSGRQGRS